METKHAFRRGFSRQVLTARGQWLVVGLDTTWDPSVFVSRASPRREKGASAVSFELGKRKRNTKYVTMMISHDL